MIPFSRPYVSKYTSFHVGEALKNQIQQGDGWYSNVVTQKIEEMYQDFTCLLVPSCTSALELSLMIIDLKPGDEVIVPSFTFPSVATAITKFWATPVFCDINSDSGCIELDGIEKLINRNTKAITWVNYGGNRPSLIALSKISKDYNLILIEDAAHNFGEATRGGVNKEFQSDFVAFSFHASKNVQCGEGGALLIRNPKFASKARIMREKGTNRHEFQLGKVSKYSWVDRGSSYLLAEVNCAILWSQIEEFDYIQSKRNAIVTKYSKELQSIEDTWGWKILRLNDQAAHIFALVAPEGKVRNEFMAKIRGFGITAVSHYEDLSSSPAGKRYGKRSTSCKNSMFLSERLVRLPLFVDLKENELDRIIDCTKEVISQIETS